MPRHKRGDWSPRGRGLLHLCQNRLCALTCCHLLKKGRMMTIWLLQAQPGFSIPAELQTHGVGSAWDWNIQKCFRQTQVGDCVLLWQPDYDPMIRGLYA